MAFTKSNFDDCIRLAKLLKIETLVRLLNSFQEKFIMLEGKFGKHKSDKFLIEPSAGDSSLRNDLNNVALSCIPNGLRENSILNGGNFSDILIDIEGNEFCVHKVS